MVLLQNFIPEAVLLQVLKLGISFEKLRAMPYTDLDRHLRGCGVELLLNRQKVRNALISPEATAKVSVKDDQEQLQNFMAKNSITSTGGSDNDGSARRPAAPSASASSVASPATASVNAAMGLANNTPSGGAGGGATVNNKHSLQVPQPRTKAQQMQQQQQNNNGSPVASPTEMSHNSSDMETGRREANNKTAGNGAANPNANYRSRYGDGREETREAREEPTRGGNNNGRRGPKRVIGRGGGYGSSSRVPCKFYQTVEGCQFGDNCRYRHVES